MEISKALENVKAEKWEKLLRVKENTTWMKTFLESFPHRANDDYRKR